MQRGPGLAAPLVQREEGDTGQIADGVAAARPNGPAKQMASQTGSRQAAVPGAVMALTPVICSQSVWLILLSLNAIGPFSSDAYLPNLREVENDLKTTKQLASLTIQVNWIVLGLINPIIGGLSDAYGRKAVTLVALFIFVGGAVGSALAETLVQLMMARVVMGVGQAVSVIASAVIRDLVDDTGDRLRVTGFFNMLQPLMILAAPSLGGVFGHFAGPHGWRYLFWTLAGWGALTMLLVALFVPESNKKYLQRMNIPVSPSPRDGFHAQLINSDEKDKQPEKGLCGKLLEMLCSVPFSGLTLTASVFMGGVRSMLSTIPFVYSDYYCITNTFYTGLLIAVPTGCGIVSSFVAVAVAKSANTFKLLCIGMVAGCIAIPALYIGGIYHDRGWWSLTAAVAVMSTTGFFVLPAMQVLVLEDFKHMSGLAAGVSKLVMTLLSTGGSMVVSALYDPHKDDYGGSDSSSSNSSAGNDCLPTDAKPLGLAPPQFLAWALCAYMIGTQIAFWLAFALPSAAKGNRS